MNGTQRQWIIVAGVLLTFAFGLVFATKIRPEMVVLGVGSRAPDFQAINVATDQPASLDAYRDRVVLLNVWATWCAPCRVEMPSMERLHRKLAGTDFRIVAVSVDADDEPVVEGFARDMGLTFDILHDRQGRIQQIYRTTGVPESFVIDRNGVIVKKVIGPTEWDGPVHETLIRQLLDAP